jgi:hypothetical protein
MMTVSDDDLKHIIHYNLNFYGVPLADYRPIINGIIQGIRDVETVMEVMSHEEVSQQEA